MKLREIWCAMQSALTDAPAPRADLVDELVVSAPMQVRRALTELARLSGAVAVRAADGGFVGVGLLSVEGARGVTLRWRDGDGTELAPSSWPLNATASGSDGLLMFTLVRGRATTAGLSGVPWPETLIRVQSRRHFRLSALGGAQRRAWLRVAGANRCFAIRDLSEEGVRIEVGSSGWQAFESSRAAELQLDDEVVQVPSVDIVHDRPGKYGEPHCLGARLVGLEEAQRRLLRCWLAAAQAASPAGPADAAGQA